MLSGCVGRNIRTQQLQDRLSTLLLCSSPSLYEMQRLWRDFPTDFMEAKSTFWQIAKNPRTLHLLDTFVIAGRWDMIESLCNRVPDHIAQPYGLLVRDKVRACRKWEQSLSPAMRAARSGDVDAFSRTVSATTASLNATDSMGYDIWFWALNGGCTDIIDQLLRLRTPLDRLLFSWFGGPCRLVIFSLFLLCYLCNC